MTEKAKTGKRGPSAFKGVVEGARNSASRLGGKKSGLHTIAAGHQGSCHVRLAFDKDSGLEICTVTLEPWKGVGKTQLVYNGALRGRIGTDYRRALVRKLLSETLNVSVDIVSQLTDELMGLL